MKLVATVAMFLILLNFVGCGMTSVVKVGMTMQQANEIKLNNDSKEFYLKDSTWGTTAWKVYTLPNNTCIELYSDNAKSLIISTITIGEKGKGYWINSSNPKNETVDKIDISDYEKED